MVDSLLELWTFWTVLGGRKINDGAPFFFSPLSTSPDIGRVPLILHIHLLFFFHGRKVSSVE